MKVMILSITAGQGHHSAAKSIAEAFELRGAKVKTVDVYKQIDKHFSDAVNKGYLLSTKHTPKAYRALYELIDSKTAPTTIFAFQNVMNILIAIRFEKFIEQFDPDIIVCTHVFAAQVVNELKRRDKLLDVPTVGIVTDYTIHPFWETVEKIEYIEIANELLTARANLKGIDTNRLLPFGIPVQRKFTSKLPKDEARRELGISLSEKVVLLMAGSMGYGNMPEIISEIRNFDKNCTIIAVCGNNKKLYNKLTKNNTCDNVRIYGFTDKVDIFMDAADCIVTKPGGLTTTEALAKNLPMIFVNPIPGQEDRNQEFFLNSGLALAVTKTFTMEEALYFLFNNPGRIEQMRKNLSEIAKPDSADKLAEFAEKLTENHNHQ